MHVCTSRNEKNHSETESLNKSKTRGEMIKERTEGTKDACTCEQCKVSTAPCVCGGVHVSEMDSLWRGCIKSLPDWLQLSGNVTGESEQDLIAIRELPESSRGQRTRRRIAPSKHTS